MVPDVAGSAMPQGPATDHVIGIDASLTRTAVVGLPADWDTSWPRVSAAVCQVGCGGQKPFVPTNAVERAYRFALIADQVAEHAVRLRASHVFIEEHAFGMAGEARALERAELVGAIRYVMFVRLGLGVEPIVASSARKLLFGTIPRKGLPKGGMKKIIAAKAYEIGAPHAWGEDEIDAFVVANAGMLSLGRLGLSVGS